MGRHISHNKQLKELMSLMKVLYLPTLSLLITNTIFMMISKLRNIFFDITNLVCIWMTMFTIKSFRDGQNF